MSPPQQSQKQNPDSLISKSQGLAYWQSISPDVNGMLGGFPHISRVDLRGSRNFLAKLGVGSKKAAATPGQQQQRVAERALEGGAGIGRITTGLLLDGIAKRVDVIEPIEKFTAELKGKEGVGKVWNVGLEEWDGPDEADVRYDLIWIQWCVGHLTDEQLVKFLRRCKRFLKSEDDKEQQEEEEDGVAAAAGKGRASNGGGGGWIVVKENNSTMGSGGLDDYDEVDSSVTRADASFRRIFKEAGLKLVQVELQKGFQVEGLLPVRMYALKPEKE